MHTGSKWAHSDLALGAASPYALLSWFESTKMILPLDSILNDKVATIWQLFVGKRERRGVMQLFFSFFYQEKNFRTDWTRSESPSVWKSDTLTTTPNFPDESNGSGDAYTRESQIVLLLPLDGSAAGPFRWTILKTLKWKMSELGTALWLVDRIVGRNP